MRKGIGIGIVLLLRTTKKDDAKSILRNFGSLKSRTEFPAETKVFREILISDGPYPPTSFPLLKKLQHRLDAKTTRTHRQGTMSIMASSAQIDTTSAIRTETVTGSHLFKVFGYSLIKGNVGIGNYITSDCFIVGGYEWVMRYYPDGICDEHRGFMALYLECQTEDNNVKAWYAFTILQPNGVPSKMTRMPILTTFRSTTDINSIAWGQPQFAKISEFEASNCLQNDSFTVKCTVTVVKGVVLEKSSPCGITVPPPNFNQNLLHLLESGNGEDVTFVVKGERFNAHRFVLAARSAVFNAELFGGMKENWTDTIIVDDIEAPVFRSVLYFIYSDSLPDFVGSSDDDGEKQDMMLMAQHLLVAANRYQLDRLKLMCEDLLYKNISMSNVAETLILAEQHNGTELKKQCLRFMSSPDVFKAVALTEGFHNLVKICPSVLKDI